MSSRFLVLAGAMALAVSSLLADDTICRGDLSGAHENVIVPDNAECVIQSARIEGNVKVESGASLTVTGPTYIGGNLQSENSRSIRLQGLGITIDGDLQVKQAFEAVSVERGTTILGNLQYEENAASFSATGVMVHGDMQIFKNYGGVRLLNNTIRQNLQCKENSPAPVGRNNRAGKKEDQCRAL